jgi:hypothetical protein
MDFLKNIPPINWDGFHQGPLSDDVWAAFRQVVTFANSYKYWKTRLGESRRPYPGESDSPYKRRKRKHEWQSQFRQEDTNMHASAHQEARFLHDIFGMVQARQNSADLYFAQALLKTVGPEVFDTMRGHERANMGALAFEAFDGKQEISDDPSTTAARWRQQNGVNER